MKGAMSTLSDLVNELVSLNDEKLAQRVINNSDVQWCLSELKDILAADMVEVVRCKDCKWYKHYEDYDFCDNYTSLMDNVSDGTFCCYGERRDDD